MPDPSFILPLLLQSALLPFLTAGALMVATPLRQVSGMQPANSRSSVGPTLAVLAGFLASYFTVLHAQWSPSPKQALDWLPWIAIAAFPTVVFTERMKTPRARIAARAVIGGIVIALTAWPAIPGIGMVMAGTVVVVTAAAICAVWTLFDSPVAQRSVMPLAAITAGMSALSLMLEASQLIGQLTGALAAALCALIAAAFMMRQRGSSDVPAGISVLLLGTLLAHAYLYAGISPLIISLLAGGLLAAAIVLSLERYGILGVRAATIVAALLSAITGISAVTLAFIAAQEAGGY